MKNFISVIFNLRISTFKIVLHFYCAKHCYLKYLKTWSMNCYFKNVLAIVDLDFLFPTYNICTSSKANRRARFGLHLVRLTLARFIISFLWTVGVWG